MTLTADGYKGKAANEIADAEVWSTTRLAENNQTMRRLSLVYERG